MWQVVIIPKDTGATGCLYFKDEQSASIVLGTIQDAVNKEAVVGVSRVVRMKDDFGFVIVMDVNNLSYAMLIDVAKSHKLHSGKFEAPKIHAAN